MNRRRRNGLRHGASDLAAPSPLPSELGQSAWALGRRGAHRPRRALALRHTRKARWVIAGARELLGGNRILLENHVIRHMGDIEVIHPFEGTETSRR
jgi:alkylation response protein AidB-like acyl-CoA dehydrogenase